MEKFIPYEKLSKKEKRKIDHARRNTWGPLKPITRKTENGKAYNRKKTQNWRNEPPDLRFFFGVFYFSLCVFRRQTDSTPPSVIS